MINVTMKYSHVTKKRLWLSFPKVSRKTFCSKPAYLFPAYDPGGSYSREVKVTQSCPTLCNPMDCTVHGILQDRILEWVAFPFSRRENPFPTQGLNPSLLHCRWILYQLSHKGGPTSLTSPHIRYKHPCLFAQGTSKRTVTCFHSFLQLVQEPQ